MGEATARHGLPMIQPGQAQKELSHNEALALIDLIAHPSVVAVGLDAPPADPEPGQCWVVGQNPVGAWTGHPNALAGWTEGGWRFVAPAPGMTVWTGGATGFARWEGGEWAAGVVLAGSLRIGGQQVVGPRAAAIADPTGGAMLDPEAHGAIGQILSALRAHGLIAA